MNLLFFDKPMTTHALQNLSIAFVGGGNMATAIVGGLVAVNASDDLKLNLLVIDPNTDKEAHFTEQGVKFTTPDNMACIAEYDVVVLAVKPQVIADIAPTLAPYVGNALVISILAGVPVERLSALLGVERIVRCMPNLPASVGQGATGLFANVPQTDKDKADAVMASVGVTVWVGDENLLHAVTAVAGSAPAYFFYALEAMIEEAVVMGLSPADAHKLAVQSMIGAGQLAKGGDPATLRSQVTSKGGTTAAALAVLDDKQVDTAFKLAMVACVKRSQELAQS